MEPPALVWQTRERHNKAAMAKEKKRRERAPNFTPQETALLTRVCIPFKSVIHNKHTDALTSRRKRECWETIAERYNSQILEGTKRRPNGLKEKYDQIARIERRKIRGEQVVKQNRQPLVKIKSMPIEDTGQPAGGATGDFFHMSCTTHEDDDNSLPPIENIHSALEEIPFINKVNPIDLENNWSSSSSSVMQQNESGFDSYDGTANGGGSTTKNTSGQRKKLFDLEVAAVITKQKHLMEEHTQKMINLKLEQVERELRIKLLEGRLVEAQSGRNKRPVKVELESSDNDDDIS